MSFLQELLGDAYKEGMTAEEIGTALQNANVGVVDSELQGKYSRLKDAFDKSASETAKYKKMYNEKLSEEEKAKIAQAEALQALKDENASLKKAQLVSQYTAQFLALGFTQAQAAETADAMADGDMDKVFRNTAAVNAAKEKAIRAEAMRQTPVPPPGDGADVMTREKFDKLGWEDQMAWIKDHPNWKTELK